MHACIYLIYYIDDYREVQRKARIAAMVFRLMRVQATQKINLNFAFIGYKT